MDYFQEQRIINGETTPEEIQEEIESELNLNKEVKKQWQK